MGQRLEYVDIAKGIGIVLVVCSHSDAWKLMWITTGFFVPIFYFCAGYTSSSLKGSIFQMMQKRFRKLFVPYTFFTLALMCFFCHFSLREFVGFLYSRYCLYPIDTSPNIKFFTTGNYPMWFLTSMIVSYFLYYIISYHEKYRLLIASIYIIVTFLLSYCPILLPWSIDTAFLTALFMYTGKMFKYREIDKFSLWMLLLVTALYVLMMFVASDINLSVRKYGNSVLLYFLMAVLGCVMLLRISKNIESTWVGAVCVVLGKHSLTIFCIQMAFIVLTQRILNFLWPHYTLDWVAGMIEVFAALVGGLLISLLLHKIPFFKRLLF